MPQILPETVTAAAEELSDYFQYFPDFPKKGITFWDVFAIFRNRKAFELLNTMISGYADVMKNKVDVVVGIESRGFLLGPLLANYLNCAFVPARKKGKLPGKTKQISYTIEYGVDILEIQEGSISNGQKVVIVDDCIATGGTICATCDLIHQVGGVVVDCMVIYCIPELRGKEKIIESDILEIQEGSISNGQKVVIVDDCIATGGTICATCDLIHQVGGVVVDCMVIYCIPELRGKEKIIESVTSLCK